MRLSVLTLKPEIAGLTVRLSVSDADLDSNLSLSEVLAAVHTLRRGGGEEEDVDVKRTKKKSKCNKHVTTFYVKVVATGFFFLSP